MVNLVYDYTVAFPLISRESLALSQTNLKKDVFIKHLLVAHDASVLSSPPQRSKEEALGLISSIKDSLDSKTLSFEGFSKKSKDYLYGRSTQNTVVVFPKENISIGDFIKVKIDDCTSATLLGKKC